MWYAGRFDEANGNLFARIGLRRIYWREPGGGMAAAEFAQVSRRQPDPREQIPVGLVELADIPHDVHVADMVALPRIDRAAIGRRRFHRSLPALLGDTATYHHLVGLAIRRRIKIGEARTN